MTKQKNEIVSLIATAEGSTREQEKKTSFDFQ